MQKIIRLGEREIEYELRISKRAKVVKLAVYHDGNFVVTMPARASESAVEKFIIKKAEWIIKRVNYAKNNPKIQLTQGGKKEFEKYKEEARVLARLRLEHFNKFYNFKWENISIKNTKTRWGSCSRKGNLNFNYKLVLLSPELSDYIVVHELCHLGEFNHSKNFWNLVTQTCPNYLELRKQIKQIF